MTNQSLKTAALAVAVFGGVAFAGTAQAADMASATALSAPCAGCHGTNGASTGPASPSIGGMTADYIELSMQAYKKGERKATIMDRIAKGYSDEEIKAMAKYFSEQKFVAAAQTPDEAQAAKGKELQAKHCENCHEDNGKKADGIGVLNGQHMPYLRMSIADFFSGVRELEKRKGQKMEALKEEAGDAGFEAVINYYGTGK